MPRGEGRGGPGRGKGAPEGEDGRVVAQRIRKGNHASQAHLVPFLLPRMFIDPQTVGEKSAGIYGPGVAQVEILAKYFYASNCQEL